MSKYLTVKEVAKIFRRSEPTIRRWIKEETFKAVKIKNGIFIPDTEIEKIEEKNKENERR